MTTRDDGACMRWHYEVDNSTYQGTRRHFTFESGVNDLVLCYNDPRICHIYMIGIRLDGGAWCEADYDLLCGLGWLARVDDVFITCYN